MSENATVVTPDMSTAVYGFLARAFMKYGWDLYVPDEKTRNNPYGRAAHLLLQTRTKVLNNELEETFRRWYPRFRAEAG